jgi:hypothetical protein
MNKKEERKCKKERKERNKNQQSTRSNEFEEHKIPSGYVGVTYGEKKTQKTRRREAGVTSCIRYH